jgi:hypothetical protein
MMPAQPLISLHSRPGQLRDWADGGEARRNHHRHPSQPRQRFRLGMMNVKRRPKRPNPREFPIARKPRSRPRSLNRKSLNRRALPNQAGVNRQRPNRRRRLRGNEVSNRQRPPNRRKGRHRNLSSRRGPRRQPVRSNRRSQQPRSQSARNRLPSRQRPLRQKGRLCLPLRRQPQPLHPVRRLHPKRRRNGHPLPHPHGRAPLRPSSAHSSNHRRVVPRQQRLPRRRDPRPIGKARAATSACR